VNLSITDKSQDDEKGRCPLTHGDGHAQAQVQRQSA